MFEKKYKADCLVLAMTGYKKEIKDDINPDYSRFKIDGKCILKILLFTKKNNIEEQSILKGITDNIDYHANIYFNKECFVYFDPRPILGFANCSLNDKLTFEEICLLEYNLNLKYNLISRDDMCLNRKCRKLINKKNRRF